jgi:hypothetical protein
MHDLLYLQRATWTRSADPRTEFAEFARQLQLDVERFNKDIAGEEVAKRVAAALGLDRRADASCLAFVNSLRAGNLSAMAAILAGKRPWVLAGLLLLSFVPLKTDAQSSSLSTGIEGVVSIGPIHGGPQRSDEPASAPLANAVFEVANDAGAVTTFTTDAAGHFRVPLAPGRYSIKRKDVKAKVGHCGPFEVEVTTSGFKQIRWDCDSGMR